MHCPNCGNPIEDDDLFCGECGHKISRHPQSVRNAESEITKAEKNDEEQNITSNNKENNAATHQNVDSTSHDETRSNENDVADSLQSKQSHNDTQQSNLYIPPKTSTSRNSSKSTQSRSTTKSNRSTS